MGHQLESTPATVFRKVWGKEILFLKSFIKKCSLRIMMNASVSLACHGLFKTLLAFIIVFWNKTCNVFVSNLAQVTCGSVWLCVSVADVQAVRVLELLARVLKQPRATHIMFLPSVSFYLKAVILKHCMRCTKWYISANMLRTIEQNSKYV